MDKNYRVNLRILDEVCLDCCDYFKFMACKNCGVNRLKKELKYERRKQMQAQAN